jgi:hypothetical protein
MPLVTYSALRLGLLAACFALGYWAGLRIWLLLFVATFAAWGLSYVLLARPREAAAVYLAERAQQRAAGTRPPGHADLDAAQEDAVVDAARARQTDAPLAEGERRTSPDRASDPDGAASAVERPGDQDRPWPSDQDRPWPSDPDRS